MSSSPFTGVYIMAGLPFVVTEVGAADIWSPPEGTEALCGAYAKNETLSLGLAGQYFTGLYVHVPFTFFTDWLHRRLGAKPVEAM